MKTWTLGFAAIATSIAISTPADATLLKYSLSGADDIVFYLDSNPTPTEWQDSKFAKRFGFEGVKGTLSLNGRIVDVNYNVYFFGAFNGGGFDLVSSDYDPEYGWEDNGYIYRSVDIIPGQAVDQLYDGRVDKPVMRTGSFDMIDVFDFLGYNETYTLTVTQATAAVPEPATWLAMIVGFGVVGGALRGKRRRGGLGRLILHGL